MTQAEGQIVSAFVSALIAGIFLLLGKVLEVKLKTMLVSTTSTSEVETVPRTSRPVNSLGIGKVKLNTMSVSTTSTSEAETVPRTSRPVNSLDIGKVLKHIGILQLIFNLLGFLIGITLGMTDFFIPMLIILGTLAAIIGFAWSGTKVNRAIRWKHLFSVAIGVTVITLIINSLALRTPILPLTIVIACIQTFGAMGIGGAITNARKL